MYNWDNDIREIEQRQARQKYIKLGAALVFASIVGASIWQTTTMTFNSRAEKMGRLAADLVTGLDPLATAEQKQKAEKALAQAQAHNLTPVLNCISQSREMVHVNEDNRNFYVKDQVNAAQAAACIHRLMERNTAFRVSPL